MRRPGIEPGRAALFVQFLEGRHHTIRPPALVFFSGKKQFKKVSLIIFRACMVLLLNSLQVARLWAYLLLVVRFALSLLVLERCML